MKRTLLIFLLISCSPTPKPNYKEVEVTWTRDHCGNRRYQILSTATVLDLLDHLWISILRAESEIQPKHFIYTHLGYSELHALMHQVEGLAQTHTLAKKVAFDLRDYAIRLSLEDTGALSFFNERQALELTAIHLDNSQFHLLTESEACPMSTLQRSQILVKHHCKQPKGRLTVLHAAMEAPNFRVGGVGTYLQGLLAAEKRDSQVHPLLLTPLYDRFKLKTLEYVGFFDHEIDHARVRSTLYQIPGEPYQYFVQPDPNFRPQLYHLGEPSRLYQEFDDEKWIYYSSALAAFAALFRGKSGCEHIDVVQINDWHLSLSSALLTLELNPKRNQAGLPSVATLATTHELNAFQGTQNGSYLLRKVGLKQPKTSHLNLQAMFQVMSSMSSTVSKTIAQEMMSIDPKVSFGLGELFSKLGELGHFVGITNGFNQAHFDPTLALGALSVAPDYSDLIDKKRQVKQLLFERGILASADRPFFLYVGRFSKEKGVDLLPEIITMAIETFGAQVLIMTSPPQGSTETTFRRLEALKESSIGRYFRLKHRIKEDQLSLLEPLGVKKGLLIRFAADVTLVPSIEETCGFVPMEALAMGSSVLTSNSHGIQDICRPFTGNLLDGQFNCFTYDQSENLSHSARALENAIQTWMKHWWRAPLNQRQEISVRWMRESRGYAWEAGALFAYKALYKNAILAEQDSQSKIRKHLRKKYFDRYRNR